MFAGFGILSLGDRHSLVLHKDGSAWATGRNNYGQLGDGSKDSTETFVKVVSGGVQFVAAGGRHSLLLKDGSVWATGYNKYGQLGDGSTISR